MSPLLSIQSPFVNLLWQARAQAEHKWASSVLIFSVRCVLQNPKSTIVSFQSDDLTYCNSHWVFVKPMKSTNSFLEHLCSNHLSAFLYISRELKIAVCILVFVASSLGMSAQSRTNVGCLCCSGFRRSSNFIEKWQQNCVPVSRREFHKERKKKSQQLLATVWYSSLVMNDTPDQSFKSAAGDWWRGSRFVSNSAKTDSLQTGKAHERGEKWKKRDVREERCNSW